MPWHKGNYIDFDPDKIARLMYEGESIQPDHGISPEQFEGENALVIDRLRSLWGNQPYRSLTSVHEKQFKNRWNTGEKIVEPSLMGTFEEPFKKVYPNPFLFNSMPTQERKKREGLLDFMDSLKI